MSEVISRDAALRLVEPGIYSIYPSGEMPGSYDSFGTSTLYDLVACKGNLAFINYVRKN